MSPLRCVRGAPRWYKADLRTTNELSSVIFDERQVVREFMMTGDNCALPLHSQTDNDTSVNSSSSSSRALSRSLGSGLFSWTFSLTTTTQS